MFDNNFLIPFLLTLFAGLATGIGSLIAFFAKRTNKRFLSFSLGFSGGVMMYVAFVELFQEARIGFITEMGEKMGMLTTVLCFFGGIFLICIIDKLIPSVENPHEIRSVEKMSEKPPKDAKMMRIGLITALGIAIHNFPEGIATFVSASEQLSLGVAIAIAVAIHNIPEGIAVSIPIYFATGSRRKAFRLSFLSGLSEPLGAVIAYLILTPFITPCLMSGILAAVAGIMVFIAIDELLPAAREYGEHHIAIYGIIAGMGVMAFSLLLLN